MSGPLDGIRILDLSRILAGPWATQLLADFGADVIKVERPGQGDDTRRWGPPWLATKDGDDSGESAYFLSTNRNKRSITVDYSQPQGQQIISGLAKSCDVMIENLRPGTLQRYGLDAESMRDGNERLIYCSISAFGQTGSRAGEAGYDAMIQAEAGLMSLTGQSDENGGAPLKVGVAISDIMTGMYATSAILAALHARQSTGKGDVIDLALYDCQVAWLANQNMNYLVGGEVPQRLGNAHPNIVPYQSFETSDGHIMLAVGNDRQFAACAACLDVQQLADDERFRTNDQRITNRVELIEQLQERFRTQTTAHWLERFRERGIPVGPINDLHDVFSSDFAKERKLVRELTHAHAGAMPTVANPVRFAESEIGYRNAPPTLGQHTHQVLSDELGYSDREIEALERSGVV